MVRILPQSVTEIVVLQLHLHEDVKKVSVTSSFHCTLLSV